MSTVLLETEEEEPFVMLVQYVAKQLDDQESGVQTALADTPGNKLTSKGQELLQSNDFAGVVRLLMPHLDMLLAAADDRSMDCCLILLIQLVVRASDNDETTATKLADELMAALATSSKEKPVARVSAMLELFNAWPRSPYQYNLLMKILAFANSEKLSQLAVPLYGRADLWDRAWQLTETQSMDMFEGIAKVLDMHPSPLLKKEAFGLQTRVLLSCPSDDKKRIEALKPTARAAALAFIGNPAQFSCDVFNTAPVQALKTDSESSKVYELLDLLLHGKLSEFDSSKYTTTLEAASTTETEVMSKMRLMALLAVCSSKEGMDVTFTEVEQALALEEGQAEGWLVQAFGKQLLDGRINQVTECVSVRRCERRVFQKEDWEKLLSDLSTWKEGLDGLDVTMKGKNLLTPSVTVHPWLSA